MNLISFNNKTFEDKKFIIWEFHLNKLDEEADQEGLYKYIEEYHGNDITPQDVENDFTHGEDFIKWLKDQE